MIDCIKSGQVGSSHVKLCNVDRMRWYEKEVRKLLTLPSDKLFHSVQSDNMITEFSMGTVASNKLPFNNLKTQINSLRYKMLRASYGEQDDALLKDRKDRITLDYMIKKRLRNW